MFLQKTLSSILFFCFFFVFLNIDRQTFILWSWNCGWSRGSSRRKPRVGCKHRASWSVRSRCRNWRRPLGTTGLLFRRRAALLRLPVETGPVTVENWDDSLKYWPNTNTTTSSKQKKTNDLHRRRLFLLRRRRRTRAAGRNSVRIGSLTPPGTWRRPTKAPQSPWGSLNGYHLGNNKKKKKTRRHGVRLETYTT